MISASRLLVQANSDLRQGGWGAQFFVGHELAGKQVGLIGHGNIGKRIEKLAVAFGMTVEYADSKTSLEELDEIIQRADYLVLCCPLNDQTRHMIDERRLSLMKRSAYLVNVARGAVVDQTALKTALQGSKILGAALDVFEGEPLSGKVSDEIRDLANMPNVIATPHIGASTSEAYVKLGDQIIEIIKAFQEGSPINLVN
jgi:D-3-phosphoglycerate dehydrogenase